MREGKRKRKEGKREGGWEEGGRGEVQILDEVHAPSVFCSPWALVFWGSFTPCSNRLWVVTLLPSLV